MSYAYTVGQQQKQNYGTNISPPELAVATATATHLTSLATSVERVMPGIYLTQNLIVWTEEILRSHGFTHIIIIDKHVQELYWPSPVFKLASPDLNDDVSPFEFYPSTSSSLSFGMEFEAIDLNFGEKSYLTTVLPNCYRAVKFINKALQSGNKVLVIDCNSSEQKCVTIVVAYLMFKHNITFTDAFARLKEYYGKADLDRFFMSQLYEYEPILQVQRAQSCGHSCSRELNAALLKRKKHAEESSASAGLSAYTRELNLNQINPLAQFNATQQLDTLPVEPLCSAPADTVHNNCAWDDHAME